MDEVCEDYERRSFESEKTQHKKPVSTFKGYEDGDPQWDLEYFAECYNKIFICKKSWGNRMTCSVDITFQILHTRSISKNDNTLSNQMEKQRWVVSIIMIKFCNMKLSFLLITSNRIHVLR